MAELEALARGFALVPALAGAPPGLSRVRTDRNAPRALEPFAPVRVAFARESAFELLDPDDFESGLSAAELGEALDGVDFFGVLSAGALGEPEPESDTDASGRKGSGSGHVRGGPSVEDPAREGVDAADRPAGPPAPIVCEASGLPPVGDAPTTTLTVRGRRHAALVAERSGDADAFLRVLSGLAPVPAGGELRLFGHAFHALSPEARAEARTLVIGAMIDALPLIESLSIEDNLLIAAEGGGMGDAEANARIDELLELCEVDAHRTRHPQEVPVVVRWRARVARAVVHRPSICIADVTTDDLDAAGRAAVLQTLGRALEGSSSTAVVVCPEASVPDWIQVRIETQQVESGAPRAGKVAA